MRSILSLLLLAALAPMAGAGEYFVMRGSYSYAPRVVEEVYAPDYLAVDPYAGAYLAPVDPYAPRLALRLGSPFGYASYGYATYGYPLSGGYLAPFSYASYGYPAIYGGIGGYGVRSFGFDGNVLSLGRFGSASYDRGGNFALSISDRGRNIAIADGKRSLAISDGHGRSQAVANGNLAIAGGMNRHARENIAISGDNIAISGGGRNIAISGGGNRNLAIAGGGKAIAKGGPRGGKAVAIARR